MRKAMMGLLGFGILAGLSPAQAQTETVTTTTQVSTTEVEQLPVFNGGSREAAAALLRNRVDTVNWADATFEEITDWFEAQGEGRVNIVPKWGSLQVEGVGRDTLVNLKLNNTTVADVLNEVVDQLSEDGQIQYRAIGNKLTISTKQDFEKKMYVRVYDVADLLFRVENFGESAPLIDLQNAGRSSGGGGQGGGGQSVFQGAGTSGQQGESSEQLEQETEERLQKLREIIEQTIAPESWDLTGSESGSSRGGPGGGGRGRIRILNTSLIVLNTIEVHEMISGAFVFGE